MIIYLGGRKVCMIIDRYCYDTHPIAFQTRRLWLAATVYWSARSFPGDVLTIPTERSRCLGSWNTESSSSSTLPGRMSVLSRRAVWKYSTPSNATDRIAEIWTCYCILIPNSKLYCISPLSWYFSSFLRSTWLLYCAIACWNS